MLINHFIIVSRAYSQQSPTCTRVNNLVYIFCRSTTHGVSVLIMFARGRGSVCVLYYTVLYVLCKNINVTYFDITLSSHDKPHHHMMNNMFGYSVRYLFPFVPTWRMISQKNFHIACASGTHSILKHHFSNQNIISI